jgi:hypothetical protein
LEGSNTPGTGSTISMRVGGHESHFTSVYNSRYNYVTAHLQARVRPRSPRQEHGRAHQLDRNHPRLAPPEGQAVDRVHDGTPQKLEAVGVGRQREDANGSV